MTAFTSIALVGNAKDLRVAECMLSLIGHFQSRGQRALVDPGVSLALPRDAVVSCPESEFASRADLIVAIGGDGTLLYAARLVAGRPVPLLGMRADGDGMPVQLDGHQVLACRDVLDHGCGLLERDPDRRRRRWPARGLAHVSIRARCRSLSGQPPVPTTRSGRPVSTALSGGSAPTASSAPATAATIAAVSSSTGPVPEEPIDQS